MFSLMSICLAKNYIVGLGNRPTFISLNGNRSIDHLAKNIIIEHRKSPDFLFFKWESGDRFFI